METGSVQMINKDGDFDNPKVSKLFSSNTELQHNPCTVVSIIGPQNCGKSTLLNETFHTEFPTSDGMSSERTTEGIWIARDLNQNMILMDVEGSDANQRKEEGASFEQKISLFCLVASDIMIFNMKKCDIGRYNAGSAPLLKAIFGECVKLKDMKKTTLLVTLRDCVPMFDQDTLNIKIHVHMAKIWKEAHSSSPDKSFEDYIALHAIAFGPPETPEFKQKCQSLEQQFSTGKLLKGTGRKYTTGGFLYGAGNMWDEIQQNTRLDVPAHREGVAMVMCERIKTKIINSKEFQKGIQEFDNLDKVGIKGLGERLENFIKRTLDEYNKDVSMYHEFGRRTNSDKLKNHILEQVRPICRNKLEKLSKTMALVDDTMKRLLGFSGPGVDKLFAGVMEDFDSLTTPLPTEYRDIVEDSKDKLSKKLKINLEEASNSRKAHEVVKTATITTASAGATVVAGGLALVGGLLATGGVVITGGLALPAVLAIFGPTGLACMGAAAAAGGAIIGGGAAAVDTKLKAMKCKEEYVNGKLAKKEDPK